MSAVLSPSARRCTLLLAGLLACGPLARTAPLLFAHCSGRPSWPADPSSPAVQPQYSLVFRTLAVYAFSVSSAVSLLPALWCAWGRMPVRVAAVLVAGHETAVWIVTSIAEVCFRTNAFALGCYVTQGFVSVEAVIVFWVVVFAAYPAVSVSVLLWLLSARSRGNAPASEIDIERVRTLSVFVVWLLALSALLDESFWVIQSNKLGQSRARWVSVPFSGSWLVSNCIWPTCLALSWPALLLGAVLATRGNRRRSRFRAPVLAAGLLLAVTVLWVKCSRLGPVELLVCLEVGVRKYALFPTALLLCWFWWPRAVRLRVTDGLACACGYNLTGNVSGICPECGTPVPPGAAPPARPADAPKEGNAQ